jgi:two-component system LytT family sensor kinase
MQRYRTVLYHLIYWLLYESLCVFFIYISSGEKPDFFNGDAKEDLLFLNIASLISFYGFYFFLFPRFLAKRKLKIFIIAGLMISLASSLVVTSIIAFLFYSALSFLPGAGVLGALLAGFFMCALINGIAATALRGVLHWWQDIRIKEALEKKNLLTELEALKSQLQPHFLFNTINNIDVLIGIEPAKASLYLQQLSRMLRFILYRGKQPTIPLEEEIQFVRDYIALQQIRKVYPGWVILQTEGIHTGLSIAPLLLLPFIENACKYADTSKNSEAVWVSIVIKANTVIFACRNLFAEMPHTDEDGGGLGLALSRQRLELTYSNRHHLEIIRTTNTFTVQCTIDL